MKVPRFLVAVSLLGCGSGAWAQDPAPDDLPYSDTVKIGLHYPVYASPIDAADDLVGAFPESLEGSQSFSIVTQKDDKDPAQLLMVVTMTGLLDDSVAAQRYTITLKPVADGWQRGAYKQESQCLRGGELSDWKVGSCP